MYTFTVEKSIIASATNTEDIDGVALYVKMGGMSVDDATLMTMIYDEPRSKIIYGDITGDMKVTISDAIFILQAIAADAVLTAEQKTAVDVNYDSDITISDVIKILQHIASPDRVSLGPAS